MTQKTLKRARKDFEDIEHLAELGLDSTQTSDIDDAEDLFREILEITDPWEEP